MRLLYGVLEYQLASNVCFFVWCLIVQVHLDHKHMGIGGDDSWTPCVHDKYLIPPEPYSFSLRLCPITAASSVLDMYKDQLPS